MLTESKRKIVMILNGNAPMRVADVNSCYSEDAHEWRYNFCRTPEENEADLAILVYGKANVDHTFDKKMRDYLKDREKVRLTPEYLSFLPTIKAIKEHPPAGNVDFMIFGIINNFLHQRFPYDFTK